MITTPESFPHNISRTLGDLTSSTKWTEGIRDVRYYAAWANVFIQVRIATMRLLQPLTPCFALCCRNFYYYLFFIKKEKKRKENNILLEIGEDMVYLLYLYK